MSSDPTRWVTILTHNTHPHWSDPKVEVDLNSIRLIEAHSFNRGVHQAVEATIRRTGLDGVQRIQTRRSKDWLAVALLLGRREP